MTRETYHHGNLRQALVQAGMAILAEHGLEALSLRGCAARAGVSHAAPRNHFATLESLHAAIAAEGFRLLLKTMQDAVEAAAADPRRRIVAACEGYDRFARARPDLFRLMFSRPWPADAYPELSEASQECHGLLREVCTPVASPTDGGRAATAAGITLWSFVHGYASLAIDGQLRRAAGETGHLPTVAEAMPPLPFAETP